MLAKQRPIDKLAETLALAEMLALQSHSFRWIARAFPPRGRASAFDHAA
jgi:hypothetical protein